MRITRDLARSPLFQLHSEGLSMEERIHVTYERAKRIAEVYSSCSNTHFIRMN